jgi:hypothetical protein
MDSVLRLRYRMLADSNGASLAPAGAVWRYIRGAHPSIELDDADESHPSPAGSYAAACAFYVALFKKDPASISFSYTLDTVQAANIRRAVKKVVYDSMSYWHIGQYYTDAAFTHTKSGSTVSLKNASLNATAYRWYFGDGQTDTAANPVHSYSKSGTYGPMLVASDSSGCRDTAYGTISVVATRVEQPLNSHPGITITIAPNPCRGKFTIDMPGEDAAATVVDVYGRSVFSGQIRDRLKVDLQHVPAGLYLVWVRNSQGAWNRRITVY